MKVLQMKGDRIQMAITKAEAMKTVAAVRKNLPPAPGFTVKVGKKVDLTKVVIPKGGAIKQRFVLCGTQRQIEKFAKQVFA